VPRLSGGPLARRYCFGLLPASVAVLHTTPSCRWKTPFTVPGPQPVQNIAGGITRRPVVAPGLQQTAGTFRSVFSPSLFLVVVHRSFPSGLFYFSSLFPRSLTVFRGVPRPCGAFGASPIFLTKALRPRTGKRLTPPVLVRAWPGPGPELDRVAGLLGSHRAGEGEGSRACRPAISLNSSGHPPTKLGRETNILSFPHPFPSAFKASVCGLRRSRGPDRSGTRRNRSPPTSRPGGRLSLPIIVRHQCSRTSTLPGAVVFDFRSTWDGDPRPYPPPVRFCPPSVELCHYPETNVATTMSIDLSDGAGFYYNSRRHLGSQRTLSPIMPSEFISAMRPSRQTFQLRTFYDGRLPPPRSVVPTGAPALTRASPPAKKAGRIATPAILPPARALPATGPPDRGAETTP